MTMTPGRLDGIDLLVSETAWARWGASLLAPAAAGARWVRVAPDGALSEPAATVAPTAAWLSIDCFFEGTAKAMLELAVSAPTMRWVHTASAGVDTAAFTALLQQGVRLSTTHVNNIPIAEYVLAQVLAAYQGHRQWVADQEARRWGHTEFREVMGTTWLVVGLGGIGTAVAERARAFGATVLGVRRTPRGDEPVDEVHTPDAVAALVERADVVVIAAPATDDTHHLVDASFLLTMRPGSLLVNVARGSLVDEAALVAALDRGVPWRAILDVAAVEPLPADSPLWGHPSVVLTPHTSAGGLGRFNRAAAAFVANLGRFLRDDPLDHEVAPADLPTGERVRTWTLPVDTPAVAAGFRAAHPAEQTAADPSPGSAEPAPVARATTWATGERFVTLRELERAARANLDDGTWAYLQAGGGDEITVARNLAAFRRWQFRPRVLTGNAQPDPATTFLGVDLAFPVLVAPFGLDATFHPDGQPGVARGAARAGTAVILSSNGSRRLEEVRAAAPAAARFLQVSALGPPEAVVSVGRRARDAGFTAVFLTVDVDAPGSRDAPAEARFSPDPVVSQGNYTADEVAARTSFGGPGWTWELARQVMDDIGLPWVVKGVLVAADAREAVAAGASAVFVSNHGGRQLDRVAGALDALPAVVAEVGAEVPVGLDGGVRRGTDVVTALALGAAVVAVGRPAAWGLAADGEDGVARVLAILRKETTSAMAMVGRGRVADLDASVVEPAPG
jgi:isopentenyl diphosphate isomerase/L-lactate dehydrogenase-like FMN-dependent dehydrogenase/phosphoglycerate dehydrogenase-like enzyme